MPKPGSMMEWVVGRNLTRSEKDKITARVRGRKEILEKETTEKSLKKTRTVVFEEPESCGRSRSRTITVQKELTRSSSVTSRHRSPSSESSISPARSSLKHKRGSSFKRHSEKDTSDSGDGPDFVLPNLTPRDGCYCECCVAGRDLLCRPPLQRKSTQSSRKRVSFTGGRECSCKSRCQEDDDSSNSNKAGSQNWNKNASYSDNSSSNQGDWDNVNSGNGGRQNVNNSNQSSDQNGQQGRWQSNNNGSWDKTCGGNGSRQWNNNAGNQNLTNDANNNNRRGDQNGNHGGWQSNNAGGQNNNGGGQKSNSGNNGDWDSTTLTAHADGKRVIELKIIHQAVAPTPAPARAPAPDPVPAPAPGPVYSTMPTCVAHPGFVPPICPTYPLYPYPHHSPWANPSPRRYPPPRSHYYEDDGDEYGEDRGAYRRQPPRQRPSNYQHREPVAPEDLEPLGYPPEYFRRNPQRGRGSQSGGNQHNQDWNSGNNNNNNNNNSNYSCNQNSRQWNPGSNNFGRQNNQNRNSSNQTSNEYQNNNQSVNNCNSDGDWNSGNNGRNNNGGDNNCSQGGGNWESGDNNGNQGSGNWESGNNNSGSCSGNWESGDNNDNQGSGGWEFGKTTGNRGGGAGNNRDSPSSQVSLTPPAKAEEKEQLTDSEKKQSQNKGSKQSPHKQSNKNWGSGNSNGDQSNNFETPDAPNDWETQNAAPAWDQETADPPKEDTPWDAAAPSNTNGDKKENSSSPNKNKGKNKGEKGNQNVSGKKGQNKGGKNKKEAASGSSSKKDNAQKTNNTEETPAIEAFKNAVKSTKSFPFSSGLTTWKKPDDPDSVPFWDKQDKKDTTTGGGGWESDVAVDTASSIPGEWPDTEEEEQEGEKNLISCADVAIHKNDANDKLAEAGCGGGDDSWGVCAVQQNDTSSWGAADAAVENANNGELNSPSETKKSSENEEANQDGGGVADWNGCNDYEEDYQGEPDPEAEAMAEAAQNCALDLGGGGW